MRRNSRPVAVGDTVELAGVKTRATVTAVNKDGSLQLQAGMLKINARADEVYLVEGAQKAKKAPQQRKGGSSAPVPLP